MRYPSYVLSAIVGAVCVGLATPAPAHLVGDPVAGETAYNQCAVCHRVDGTNAIGPHLDEVVGRLAGSVETFNYSDAMSASGVVWTTANLDAFIEDPRGFIPNTTMVAGEDDPQERLDIVAYLQTLGVAPSNAPPIAEADSYAIASRQTLAVGAGEGVLVNDGDEGGEPLVAQLVAAPLGGNLDLFPDGSFEYTPGDAFVLSDSFEYHPNDGAGDGNDVIVTLTAEDRDRDGLADFVEVEIGSSTEAADTDGDGVPDGEEFSAGRDPVLNEAAAGLVILNTILGN